MPGNLMEPGGLVPRGCVVVYKFLEGSSLVLKRKEGQSDSTVGKASYTVGQNLMLSTPKGPWSPCKSDP